MWIVFIALSLVACWITSGTGLFGVAVVNALLAVGSNGILANFSRQPSAAPNWAAALSMLTLLGSVALGVIGLFIR